MQIIKTIQNRIYEIRGERIILDRDLAELYDVPVKSLNQAVKRNIIRFPTDFMFQLSREEYDFLRFEFQAFEKKKDSFQPLRLQIVTIETPGSIVKFADTRRHAGRPRPASSKIMMIEKYVAATPKGFRNIVQVQDAGRGRPAKRPEEYSSQHSSGPMFLKILH